MQPDQIQFIEPEKLYLDPKNPRLGRRNTRRQLSQDELLDIMNDWSLDELAVSFLESGFWPHEALIVVEEKIQGQNRLVVVEGNRRLAALKMLQQARRGELRASLWRNVANSYPDSAFERLNLVPYIMLSSRREISSFLGFRHVTGIKEWDPAEKAQFIAYLIEDEGLTYEQVRRRIGSKTPTVRQNYISYRLLLQMEDESERVDIDKVESRFSVLYLSLRTRGVRRYLEINIDAPPEDAKRPVPPDRLEQLANFARWLFGVERQAPVVTDSRDIDEFGRILESEAAIDYLERNEAPSFAVASRIAGVAESVIAEHVERAADEAEEALKAAHQYKDSRRLRAAVRRLALDTLQLLATFPDIRNEVLAEIQ